MTQRQRLKKEIESLELAKFDLEAALVLCELLEERKGRELTWGIWTGIVTSYARPFTRGTRWLGQGWSTCPDPGMQELHDRLYKLRNTIFAHNDKTDARGVMVFPPWDQAPLHTSEEQRILNPNAIGPIQHLCHKQLERIKERLAKALEELFDEPLREEMEGLGHWQKMFFPLDDVPDA